MRYNHNVLSKERYYTIFINICASREKVATLNNNFQNVQNKLQYYLYNNMAVLMKYLWIPKEKPRIFLRIKDI